MARTPRVVVLTISDRSYLGLREDRSGPAIRERILAWGWEILGEEILPDELEDIVEALCRWAEDGADLIVTTGGTGLGPRDRTPEATAEAADRLVPGIPELLRSAAGREKPHAYLSRGIAALRGSTLLVNLPGSPRAVVESLAILQGILPHALEQAKAGPNWGGADVHP